MSKIATIFIPSYKANTRFGATPEPYRRNVIDTFETLLDRKAVDGIVIKGAQVTAFGKPDYRGERTRILTYPYSFAVENPTTLAEIIAAAIDGFAIPNVLVQLGDEAELFTPETVEALGTGLSSFSSL